MKQVLQNRSSGLIRIESVPVPMAAEGAVLVSNHCSVISAGTERSTVSMSRQSLIGKARARPDLVRKVVQQARSRGISDTYRLVRGRLEEDVALGYSSAGVVIEVGSGVSGFHVGQRVACAGQGYASHAEYVSVPVNLCVAVPDQVPLDHAAYVALGAIAMQGVRQCGVGLSDCVVVIGLGLVGQIALRLLLAAGCVVVACDTDPLRRDRASRAGARLAVAPDQLEAAVYNLTDGHGADCVLIAASASGSEPVELAGTVSRHRGRVVVVGDVGMRVPRESYYARELELRMSTSYGPGRYDVDYEEQGLDYPYGYVRWTENRNMAAFIDLLAHGRVEVAGLTTHHFNVDLATEAYELLIERREPSLGILLEYAPAAEQPAWRRAAPQHRSVPPPRAGLALGIIGTGSHFRDALLPVLRDVSGVSIAAVCSAGGVSAATLRDRVGARYAASDPQELIDDPRLDAVIIATRHDSHGPLVERALRAGKHVFVEKPLCIGAAELESIERAYRDAEQGAPRVLAVGFNRRHSPHAVRIQEFLGTRCDPLVMNFRVNAGALPANHWLLDPRIGGGRIVGEGCHFVDFFQFICAAMPAGVQATAVGSGAPGARPTSCAASDAIVQVAFTDGSVGNLIYSASGDPALAKERLEIFGGGRAVVLDDFKRTELYANGRVEQFRTRLQNKGIDAGLKKFLDDVRAHRADPIRFAELVAVTRAMLQAAACLGIEPGPVG